MNLSDLGEFGFLERMRSWLRPGNARAGGVGAGGVRIGIGDDAAVLDVRSPAVVASADALIVGEHFRLDWSSPADVGFKAVSVNVSDIAAMGAEARWLLLVIAAPADTPVDTLEGIYAGIEEAGASYGVELVGGDTVRSSQLMLSVTALGELGGEPLLRSGAQVGDVLAVTGPLGRAAAGVNLLLSQDPKTADPTDALACIDAHRRPVARVGAGRRLADAGAHAGIDVTDGLASDARRIAEASGVGIEIDADRLPLDAQAASVAAARGWDATQMVLGGGEDLELLVAIPPHIDPATLDLIACGTVVEDGAWLVSGSSRTELASAGYDHFRAKGSGP